MTVQQAQNIPLSILLEKIGFSTTKTKHNGNDKWYKSPFRPQEQEASFHVNVRKNVWYDFGEGRGGNLIAFVQRFNNCDVSDALSFLATLFAQNTQKDIPNNTFKTKIPEKTASLILTTTQNIANPQLITYLSEERRIDINTAKKFLLEILYTQPKTNKKYYALGMLNRSGGYEIRNKYFKGSVIQKDITILFAKPTDDHQLVHKVSIFEGIFDFLSAYEYYGATLTEGEIIVMHSLAMKKMVIEYLKKRQFSTIYTYFDNDRAGEEMTLLINKNYPSVHEPCSALFLPFRDFNAFWRAKKP